MNQSEMRYLEFFDKSKLCRFMQRKNWMSVQDSEDAQVPGAKSEVEKGEVLHLCHAWYERGKEKVKSLIAIQSLTLIFPQEGPVMSKDMLGRGSSRRAQYAKAFMMKRRLLDYWMSQMLLATDKRQYATFSKSFAAGRSHSEAEGVFLGSALVYKLQVKMHRDGKDLFLCGITNAGQYIGAILVIPQLGLKIW